MRGRYALLQDNANRNYHRDYNLFFFDFRYFGESEGAYTTAGKNEVLDLLAAIGYLEKRGIKEVGVWGFSMGGAVAIMTASKTSAIKAIVAESSYAQLEWMAQEYYRLPVLRYPLAVLTRLWGRLFLGYDLAEVSPAESLKKMTIPILLIYSKNDAVVPLRHGELLQQNSLSNPKAEVIVLEQGEHGQLMQDHEKIVGDFFKRYL